MGAVGCREEKKEAPPEPRVAVEVKTPIQGPIRRILHFSGDVRPFVEVKVFAKVPDRIRKLFVEEGDRVRKGAVIAEVKGERLGFGLAQAIASLEAARANVRAAKEELDRVRKLYEVQAVSKAQLDNVRAKSDAALAQAEALEAAVGQTRVTYKDTTITSPIDGIISRRFVSEGDMASPTIPICTVVDMDQVRVDVQVTEYDYAWVKQGMPVEVRVGSYPDRIFHGKVERVSPTLDIQTKMAEAEVVIANEEHLLRPGMFASVSIIIDARTEAILIPEDVLLLSSDYDGRDKSGAGSDDKSDRPDRMGESGNRRDGDYHYLVYVVGKGNKVEARIVTIGYRENGVVEVVKGLELTDRFVTKGQQFLEDGDLVTIVDDTGTTTEDISKDAATDGRTSSTASSEPAQPSGNVPSDGGAETRAGGD